MRLGSILFAATFLASPVVAGAQPVTGLYIRASSEESVGDVRFRQFAKCMIQCDFRDVEGSEAVGFSHGQFGPVVEALDHTAG